MVNEKVIVECKATTKYNEIFEAQILTYLRLTDLKLGPVINFGEKLVKAGIHRVVNGLKYLKIASFATLASFALIQRKKLTGTKIGSS